ncbi:MAG: hypothetical protein ACLQQ4_01870 [Bacteroidia bacterium]
MKKTIVTLLGFLMVMNFSYGQAKKKSGKLDKKTYTCVITPAGKKKSLPDEIKFSGGIFQCKELTDAGFKPSEYEATVDTVAFPHETSFTCEAKDDKDNTFTWEGKVTGDDIEGSATLTDKKGKTKKSLTFTGTLKGKKAARK